MTLLDVILKFFTGTIERPSPSDLVKREAITDDADAVVHIDLKQLTIPHTRTAKVWIPDIPDTNSMDGYFDAGNHNILISYDTSDATGKLDQEVLIACLRVGDIAVYRTATIYAIHRIVKIDFDREGKYYRFKGDNNSVADPDKVRADQIKYVSVGVIY